MGGTVINPYVFDNEIFNLKKYCPWQLEWLFERDDAHIGPDMMYQKLWRQCNSDIFICHANMEAVPLSRVVDGDTSRILYK